MYDKNPIIKKTTIPFKELKSLRVPYAGNCAPDHEKLNVKGNCNCDCDCDCHCDCYYTQDCACDCEQSFCDCNCVCDCGGWAEKGVLQIPEGAKKIFDDTYRGKDEISSVIFPEGLEVIGARAFCSCSNLKSISLPKGLLKIDAAAFCGCRIREVDLPDSVTELEWSAFGECNALSKVRLGASLKSIGEKGWHHAFWDCRNLTEFEVHEANLYFKAVDGALLSEDGKTFYAYPGGKEAEEYTIPEGVTAIADYAFAANRRLKKIILPDGVQWIHANAFSGASVKELSFPKSLSVIGDHAFFDCQRLTNVEFRGKRSEYKVKLHSSWCFSLNHHRERPYLRTQDGCSWSL